MPFTPSHAVVALAFTRTPLVPAAVAVGAMAPDLPLFVRAVIPSYASTHSLEWLPVTVLVALLLLLVWRCALRPGVRELSPRWLAARLPEQWDAGAAAAVRETFGARGGRAVTLVPVVLLLASLTLGVLSHIGWDLFTHEGRWGQEVVPALGADWGPLPGYTWLQHGSSLAGLVILAVWGSAWLRRRRPAPVRRMLPATVRIAWWVSLPVVLALAWVAGLTAFGPLTEEWTPAHLAYRVLPPACAVWGLLTISLTLGVSIFRGNTALDVGSDPS